MRRWNHGWAACPGLLLVVTMAAAPLSVQAQGVTVALQPASQTVAPGDTFSLTIQVTQAGSAFNGFDAYVGYDPAALTLLPRSPISLQEGAYFASACANRFHLFKQGADRDTITNVLLCNGVSVTGPGSIYRLKFRASSTPQVTVVRFLPGLQFYNEGLFVNPANSRDAAIGIGMPAGVGDAPPQHVHARLTASPNPSRSGTTFKIEMDRAGAQQLLILDLQGRVVRHLESGTFEAGIRMVRWDGRSDSGSVARPGVYLATLLAPGRTLRFRYTLLD